MPDTKDTPKEVALAAHVVQWLRDQHWDIYQEVGTGYGMPVADIVAVCGKIHWIVSCKTALSLAVLDQALWWCGLGHYISIAVPGPAPHSSRRRWPGVAVCDLLDRHGIGLLCVYSEYEVSVNENRSPSLYRKATGMGRYLTEQQKDWAPAGSQHGRWTPFGETCRELIRYVAGHCGCTLKDAMDNIAHHYHSAQTGRSCMRQWLARGIVPGVKATLDGHRIRLHSDVCRCARPEEEK